ncbi:MAG: TIGR01212 family radical SAM protein [Gallintestinimicrobium sp.]
MDTGTRQTVSDPYFQAYTNVWRSGQTAFLLEEALSSPEVAGISIATRPDCLSDIILEGLDRLQLLYPDRFIWIELGLQSIHDHTAARIRRGYPTSVFYDAAAKLHARRLPFIVHLILGLPGETRLDLLESIRAVNQVHPFGVKLQLLHILKGTDLALLYEAGKLPVLTQEEYLNLLTSCIAALSPDICLHRVTGDGPRKLLIAPQWSLSKRNVLNGLHALRNNEISDKGIIMNQEPLTLYKLIVLYLLNKVSFLTMAQVSDLILEKNIPAI